MQSDNLISLKDDMVAFIAGHGMRRLNGYVTEEVPTGLFEDDNVDAGKDFVEELRDQTFPDEDARELDDAEYLVNPVGKVGYLQLGFAHQGVMFIFEIATDWYDSFQDLLETVSELGGIVVDDRESDE